MLIENSPNRYRLSFVPSNSIAKCLSSLILLKNICRIYFCLMNFLLFAQRTFLYLNVFVVIKTIGFWMLCNVSFLCVSRFRFSFFVLFFFFDYFWYCRFHFVNMRKIGGWVFCLFACLLMNRKSPLQVFSRLKLGWKVSAFFLFFFFLVPRKHFLMRTSKNVAIQNVIQQKKKKTSKTTLE